MKKQEKKMLRDIHRRGDTLSGFGVPFRSRKEHFYKDELRTRERRSTFESLVEQGLILTHKDNTITDLEKRKRLRIDEHPILYAELTKSGHEAYHNSTNFLQKLWYGTLVP